MNKEPATASTSENEIVFASLMVFKFILGANINKNPQITKDLGEKYHSAGNCSAVIVDTDEVAGLAEGAPRDVEPTVTSQQLVGIGTVAEEVD